jgi:hypothetical protein
MAAQSAAIVEPPEAELASVPVVHRQARKNDGSRTTRPEQKLECLAAAAACSPLLASFSSHPLLLCPFACSVLASGFKDNNITEKRSKKCEREEWGNFKRSR